MPALLAHFIAGLPLNTNLSRHYLEIPADAKNQTHILLIFTLETLRQVSKGELVTNCDSRFIASLHNSGSR